MLKINSVFLLVAAFLCSCQSADIVVEDPKSQITLEKALFSIGRGLNEMHKAQSETVTGLIPESVEVTFNVSAGAKDSSELMVAVGTPPKLPVVASVEGGISTELSASRSNQVTVKFTNILLASEKSLLAGKSTEDIAKILAYLKRNNICAFFFPNKPDGDRLCKQ